MSSGRARTEACTGDRSQLQASKKSKCASFNCFTVVIMNGQMCVPVWEVDPVPVVPHIRRL